MSTFTARRLSTLFPPAPADMIRDRNDALNKFGKRGFVALFAKLFWDDSKELIRSVATKQPITAPHVITQGLFPTERRLAVTLLILLAAMLLSPKIFVTADDLPIAVATPVSAPVVATPVLTRTRFEIKESGEAPTKHVAFGELAGENMGVWRKADKKNPRNLNSLYSGVEGITPTSQPVNYCGQLGLAWQAKLKRKVVSGATVKQIPYILDSYCKGTRTLTDLPTYIGDVNERLIAIRPLIDFDGFCKKVAVDTEGCALVKAIDQEITAEHIGAYGLTELMPRQTDGYFNATHLDHTLRTAGIEYIMSMPALADKYGSLGLFQFTSLALGHTEKGREGASVVNQFVAKGYTIPDSVLGKQGLKANDHDQAAHFFVIYNTASLIAKLDNTQRAVLWQVVYDKRMDELTEFFATSHHAPGTVRGYAKKWLNAGAKKPFSTFLKGRFVTYAKKTRHNLIGLRAFLADKQGDSK